MAQELRVRTIKWGGDDDGDWNETLHTIEGMGFRFVKGGSIEFGLEGINFTLILFKPTEQFDPKDVDATIASIEKYMYDEVNEGDCLKALVVTYQQISKHLSVEWIWHG